MSNRDDGKDAERSIEGTRSSRQCWMDIYEPSLRYVYGYANARSIHKNI
jgi:hypothetical protein